MVVSKAVSRADHDNARIEESRLMAFELMVCKAFKGIEELSGPSGMVGVVVNDNALTDDHHLHPPGFFWAFAPLDSQERTQPGNHMSLMCWEGRELRLSPKSLSFCGCNTIQWRSLGLTALALGMIDDAKCIAGCEVVLTRDPLTGDILCLSITLTGL